MRFSLVGVRSRSGQAPLHTSYGCTPAVYFARLLLSYPILLIPCCNFCMNAAQILFPIAALVALTFAVYTASNVVLLMIWIRLFLTLAK